MWLYNSPKIRLFETKKHQLPKTKLGIFIFPNAETNGRVL